VTTTAFALAPRLEDASDFGSRFDPIPARPSLAAYVRARAGIMQAMDLVAGQEGCELP
jgi:hypothetical protein